MEKRNAYIKKLEDSLTAYDAKLVEMKVKVAEVQSDMRAEYLSQIEKLEHKRADFAIRYAHLKESSEHAWGDVKVGTENAWSELEDSFEKALARFK